MGPDGSRDQMGGQWWGTVAPFSYPIPLFGTPSHLVQLPPYLVPLSLSAATPLIWYPILHIWPHPIWYPIPPI